MNYQDHGTKFLHLRPPKSKHAANEADELFKFFFIFGASLILQSDNEREFLFFSNLKSKCNYIK